MATQNNGKKKSKIEAKIFLVYVNKLRILIITIIEIDRKQFAKNGNLPFNKVSSNRVGAGYMGKYLSSITSTCFLWVQVQVLILSMYSSTSTSTFQSARVQVWVHFWS